MVFQNNSAERVAFACYNVGFDPYWGEGNIPGNIVISGNLARSCSYTLPQPAPAIYVYDLNGNANTVNPVIKNVQITSNIIDRPHVWGIGVTQAQNVIIASNLINNPVAVPYEQSWGWNRPYDNEAAILLTAVGSPTSLINNFVTGAQPSLAPETLRATTNTNRANVGLCNNRRKSITGAIESLPDSLWTLVDDSDPSLTYVGQWAAQTWNGDYNGTLHLSSHGTDSVTFTFQGVRGRVYFNAGLDYGLADIYLDGKRVAVLDTSVVPTFADPNEDLGTQAIYDTGVLASGRHTVKVLVDGRLGRASRGVRIAIDAADYVLQ